MEATLNVQLTVICPFTWYLNSDIKKCNATLRNSKLSQLIYLSSKEANKECNFEYEICFVNYDNQGN